MYEKNDIFNKKINAIVQLNTMILYAFCLLIYNILKTLYQSTTVINHFNK